jgi:acetyl esterase
VLTTPPTPSAQAEILVAVWRQHDLWDRSIDELRAEHRRRLVDNGGPLQRVRSIDDVEAGGVQARLYQSFAPSAGVLVWLHGGGWMVGDLSSEDALARTLTARSGWAVLCVDYRLMPEHRFPAALDDAWAATRWALTEFDRVAVGGDSAGGNLAAATALKARDLGAVLDLQVLVYPMLDSTPDLPAHADFRERYADFAGIAGLGPRHADDIRRLWETYAGPADRSHPLVSPARAESLAGVAPALILTAEHDILRAEAIDYHERLRSGGVASHLVDYPGQLHGFFHMLGAMDDAQDAADRVASALNGVVVR